MKPTLTQAIGAELVRARHTASARLPLLGVTICLIQGIGGFGATREFTRWDQLLMWQGIYLTGLLIPLSTLLIGLAVARENRASEGGTLWRPVSPRTTMIARFVMLAVQLLCFNLAITMPALVFGWLRGWFPGPAGRLFPLALVMWVGSLGACTLAYALARRAGLLAATCVSIGWQIAGTVRAESSSWWAEPWTWSVRPALPLLGIHANATPLEPGSALWRISPWAGLGLSMLLAVAVLTILAYAPPLTPRRGGRDRSVPSVASPPGLAGDVRRVSPAPVRAIAGTLRHTPILPLTLASAVGLGLVAAVWNADYVRGLFGYAILPLGCSLLACLVWQATRGGWRLLRTRASVRSLCAWTMIPCVVVLSTLVLVTMALVTLGSGRMPQAYATLAWLLGIALIAVNLWLATRFGTAAALGATLVAWVLSLIFGGALREGPLWFLGILTWPMSATEPARVAAAAIAAIALGAVGFTGWSKAAAHA